MNKSIHVKRCQWPGSDELMIKYHDEEWGVALTDDDKLFEFIVLDTFQAGLSWKTVLHKRENFRAGMHGFDAEKIAVYEQHDVERLLADKGIIRNRMKIEAAIRNASVFIEIRAKYGSFSKYIWQFTDGKTIHNAWKRQEEIPASSRESDAMSRDLKSRGFAFAGSTICYAFMQAAGMVNDHLTDCFRYQEIVSGQSIS